MTNEKEIKKIRAQYEETPKEQTELERHKALDRRQKGLFKSFPTPLARV